MACIKLPDLPPLPNIFPFVIDMPVFPPIDLGIDLCCKFAINIPIPPIPLGPLVIAIPGFAAIMATLNAVEIAINTVIDNLPLSCPIE